MEKTIEIGNQNLVLRSSLYSLINYKARFGTELFNDIKRIDNVKEENITDVLEVIFRIVFVLTNPKEGETFEDFVNRFDLSILSDAKLLERLSNAIVGLLKTDGKEGEDKGAASRQEALVLRAHKFQSGETGSVDRGLEALRHRHLHRDHPARKGTLQRRPGKESHAVGHRQLFPVTKKGGIKNG